MEAKAGRRKKASPGNFRKTDTIRESIKITVKYYLKGVDCEEIVGVNLEEHVRVI